MIVWPSSLSSEGRVQGAERSICMDGEVWAATTGAMAFACGRILIGDYIGNAAARLYPFRLYKRKRLVNVHQPLTAFGYSGDANAHTPAIDALASESVSF